MSCLTYGHTAIFAYYAYSSDEQEQEKIRKFWVWIEVPITVTAMSISFTLKPRREDRLYKIFLYYFAYTFVSTFLGVVGNNFEARTTAEACVRSLFWLALLKLGMVFRSSIANLPVKELSNFLINDVVMGGMIIGLGQLALLAFASIQCDGEAGGDWRECKDIDEEVHKYAHERRGHFSGLWSFNRWSLRDLFARKLRNRGGVL